MPDRLADLADIPIRQGPRHVYPQEGIRGPSREYFAQPSGGNLGSLPEAQARAEDEGRGRKMRRRKRRRKRQERQREEARQSRIQELEGAAIAGYGRAQTPDEHFIPIASMPDEVKQQLAGMTMGGLPLSGFDARHLSPQTVEMMRGLQARGPQPSSEPYAGSRPLSGGLTEDQANQAAMERERQNQIRMRKNQIARATRG